MDRFSEEVGQILQKITAKCFCPKQAGHRRSKNAVKMASKSSRYRQEKPKIAPGRLQKWSEDAAVPFKFCVVGCTRHFEQKLKRSWTAFQKKLDIYCRKSLKSVFTHGRPGTGIPKMT